MIQMWRWILAQLSDANSVPIPIEDDTFPNMMDYMSIVHSNRVNVKFVETKTRLTWTKIVTVEDYFSCLYNKASSIEMTIIPKDEKEWNEKNMTEDDYNKVFTFAQFAKLYAFTKNLTLEQETLVRDKFFAEQFNPERCAMMLEWMPKWDELDANSEMRKLMLRISMRACNVSVPGMFVGWTLWNQDDVTTFYEEIKLNFADRDLTVWTPGMKRPLSDNDMCPQKALQRVVIDLA